MPWVILNGHLVVTFTGWTNFPAAAETDLVLDRADFKWCVYKQQPANRRPLMCQHGRKISHKRLCEVRRLSETNNAVCNTWGVKTDWILCHKFKRRISLFDASQRGIKCHILHGCVLAEQFLLNVYIKVIWNSKAPPPLSKHAFRSLSLTAGLTEAQTDNICHMSSN